MILKGGEPFYLPGGPVGCLLVHGFVSAPQEMHWLGERLNAVDFTVLGVRLYGHATQPSDLYRVRLRDWIASIEDGYHAISDHCEKIAIVGMSLGGALALVSSTSVPFKCAVIISTPYQTIPYSQLSFLQIALPVIGLLQILVKFLPKPPPLDFIDRQAAKDHLTYSVFPSRGVLETHRLLARMRKVLPQLSIPILVIHSQKDRGVPMVNAESIIKSLEAAKVESLFIERSGHVILLEPERDRAAEAIVNFIELNAGLNS
jgi:carboxylesterase